MLKWLLTLFVALAVISAASPRLRRLGLGHLPGDFRIPFRGRIYTIPFASTVALSLLVWAIGRFV